MGFREPLPPSPQLPPEELLLKSFSYAILGLQPRNVARLCWRSKQQYFLQNLHETDKSLVPSGGNALVLINRKGRCYVSCKSERAWYAQREPIRKDQFHVGHEVIWRTLQNRADLTNSSCSEQQILVFFLQITEHKDKTNLAKVRGL